MQNASKVLRFVGVMFAGAGLLLLIVGAGVFYFSYDFSRKAIGATGEVYDVVSERKWSSSSARTSTLYYPCIRFQTEKGERIQFKSSTGSGSAAYEVGERVHVVYDPRQPTEARIDSLFELWFLPLFLGGIGLVFLTTGGGMLWFPHRARKRVEWLRASGTKISAEIQRVELNQLVRVNGKHPHRIVCQGTDPFIGQVREFRSKNLYFDPAPLLHEKALEVWIHPKARDSYWVETEFLEDRHNAQNG